MERYKVALAQMCVHDVGPLVPHGPAGRRDECPVRHVVGADKGIGHESGDIMPRQHFLRGQRQRAMTRVSVPVRSSRTIHRVEAM